MSRSTFRLTGQTAEDHKAEEHIEGPAKLVTMVKDIMEPVGKMDGDSLPVSAFVAHG